MVTLPKISVRRGDFPGNQILVDLPDLSDYEYTYLSADEASGQTELSVVSSANFSANEYIVIENPGKQTAEIRLISSVSAGIINVSAATTFAHNRGVLIRFIPFNQVSIENDTDSAFGSATTDTVDLRIDALQTFYEDTDGLATDFYRARFYHSQGNRYSSYSEAPLVTGYAANTPYSIKKRALDGLGEERGGKITEEFLDQALLEGRRNLDQDQRILRWSFRTKFNTDIGTCIPGQWSVSSPDDLRDPNTHKNILEIRIGKVNYPLDYQDRVRFNQNYVNIAHTTLNGAITTASTSIVLTSSGDFDEAATIQIAGSAIGEEIDDVQYTANNESTDTLSGVTGIGTNKATGIDVWQETNFGLPTAYTIDDGRIYFDLPFENSLDGENIFMDYYQELQEHDSDADPLDEPFYDLFVPYLRWRIKYLKSNGKLKKENDPDWIEWRDGVDKVIAQELSGQDIYLIPA